MENKRVISFDIVLLLVFGHLVFQGSTRLSGGNPEALALFYFGGFIGIALSVWGSYIWVTKKNRKGYWCLWGLLSPIGILPLALLKYKEPNIEAKKEGV